MKKIDLGQTITILANLGVIAGIVFLGVELRQNNELMEAQARSNVSERLIGLAEALYQNPELAAALTKSRNDQDLSDVEEEMLYAFDLRRLRGYETQYREFREGVVDSIDASFWRSGFHGGSAGRSLSYTWERAKPGLSPDFIEWMEENVVNIND